MLAICQARWTIVRVGKKSDRTLSRPSRIAMGSSASLARRTTSELTMESTRNTVPSGASSAVWRPTQGCGSNAWQRSTNPSPQARQSAPSAYIARVSPYQSPSRSRDCVMPGKRPRTDRVRSTPAGRTRRNAYGSWRRLPLRARNARDAGRVARSTTLGQGRTNAAARARERPSCLVETMTMDP